MNKAVLSKAKLMVEGATLKLCGDLTFQTVPWLAHQLEQIEIDEIEALDCSGVIKVDSSSIAFLLFAMKMRSANRPDIKLVAIPSAVFTLAKLYGVEWLLPSSPSAHQ